MGKRALMLLGTVILTAGSVACRRTGGSGDAPKYPRRAPGCALAIFNAPTPVGVPSWDDLGIAEVACHINTAFPQCFDRLRAEACRKGGDILYNVPKNPLRPRDELVVLRGQVGHTRGKSERQIEEEAPPATPGEAAGPVQPLVVPVPSAADGGSAPN